MKSQNELVAEVPMSLVAVWRMEETQLRKVVTSDGLGIGRGVTSDGSPHPRPSPRDDSRCFTNDEGSSFLPLYRHSAGPSLNQLLLGEFQFRSIALPARTVLRVN